MHDGNKSFRNQDVLTYEEAYLNRIRTDFFFFFFFSSANELFHIFDSNLWHHVQSEILSTLNKEDTHGTQL